MKPRSPRFEHHDWHEVKEMAAANMVVLIPAATVEQHGPHLPCDVDNLIVQHICDEAAKRRPDLSTVAPLIPFGFNEHNMGFPGCIHIQEHTLIDMYADVAMSFVRMGFRKVLFINGHGSNPSFLQIASRKVVNNSEAHVSTVNWWSFIPDVIKKHRETKLGGMAHACELETSMYLHICPERVRMERAVADIAAKWSEQVWVDLESCGPVAMIDDWSRVNATGVEGDPMKSTAEKGRIWSEATIERLISFMDDYRQYPVKPRRNFNFVPTDPGGPKA
ncbi:MAG: creatininase family protein [Planctomycetes bacterium]|nr:creatininase family protein [Planctomycetota bacterium]